jgi:hypothetical protein
MSAPSIYKKISFQNLRNRPLSPLSSDENTRVDTILEKFRTSFIAKHS